MASIRRQVDNLSSKDYANTVTPKEGYANLPLVAMFCPFDTVLEAALIADPALVQYAYEKNIVFVAIRVIIEGSGNYDNAIPIGFQEERVREGHKKHPNFVGYHNYVGKIADAGKEYYVRITVQEERTRSKTYNPNSVHSTFVSDVELYKESDLQKAVASDRDALSRSTTSVGERERGPSTDNILAEFLAEGKEASKVVDENGEPLVVYHRTDADFTAFDRGLLESRSDWATARFGFYFQTENTGFGQKSMPVYLNIRNPYEIKVKSRADFDYDYKRLAQGDYAKEFKGHDGLIIEATEGKDKGKKWFVAFKPEQIKSATDNIGTFDGGNPDIRYARSGKRRDEVYDDVLRAVRAGGQRVAAGRSERTDAGFDAGAALWMEREGQIGKSQDGSMTLAYSEALRLYRALMANPSMPKVLAKMPHLASRDRRGRLRLNAAAFGIVDKSDMEAVKAGLKRDGMFLNEDASWRMRNGSPATRGRELKLITDYEVVKGNDKESVEEKIAILKKAEPYHVRGRNE